jgi:hypothetical protein
MRDLHRRWIVFLLVVLLASAIDLLASSLLRNPTLGSGAARIAIALMPLPGDIALIFLVLRAVRRLDEFQKRVHFEAITVAFLSTGVAVFVCGYLQQAHIVGFLNSGVVWAFMLIFYALGYLIAANHYR